MGSSLESFALVQRNLLTSQGWGWLPSSESWWLWRQTWWSGACICVLMTSSGLEALWCASVPSFPGPASALLDTFIVLFFETRFHLYGPGWPQTHRPPPASASLCWDYSHGHHALPFVLVTFKVCCQIPVNFPRVLSWGLSAPAEVKTFFHSSFPPSYTCLFDLLFPTASILPICPLQQVCIVPGCGRATELNKTIPALKCTV